MNGILMNDNTSLNISIMIAIDNPKRSISHREQMIIDAFNSYIQIGIGSLLFLFGLTFNCLSLLYFHVSRSFRHTTFRFYFSIISILDTIRLFEFLIFLLFDKGYLRVTLNLCRSIFFTIMFTGQASIWLTVALAVEKCIIIWFPLKGRLFFTMFKSKFVLISILCVVLFGDIIYLLPTFFLHAYENRSIHTFMCVWQSTSQTGVNKNDQWKKHYFTFNTVFFHSIIPSILLLILNWLILCCLSKQRTSLAKIGSIDAKNILKREKQFKEKTIQLVLSSFFVIITISPRYILTMINAFTTNLRKTPIMPLYIYVNLNTVFRVLEMCNFSLNIIFAIMSGQTSRLEIRKLVSQCLFHGSQQIQTNHHEMKLVKQPLSYEDENDNTDCSIEKHNKVMHLTLTCQPSSYHSQVTPNISNETYTAQHNRISREASYLSCFRFVFDFSSRKISSSKSIISIHRTQMTHSKESQSANHLLSKASSSPQSSVPTSSLQFNHAFRQQNSIHCRPSRQIRTETPINYLENTSSSTFVPFNSHSSMHQTLLKKTESLTNEDPCEAHINLNESLFIIETDFNETLSPAYIIETC